MLFVYMKCRFSLSYRELEERASIRGAKIDHATLQRWLIKFSPLIDQEVRKRKKPVGNSWRMDETYMIKVVVILLLSLTLIKNYLRDKG